MCLRGEITRNCYASSTIPNTHGMVSHRHKTYLSSRLFLLALTEKQGKSIDCNGSSLPLFSIPSLLRIADDAAKLLESLYKNLVEHVDDQKRFQEYSYPLVYFAAFQLRG